MCLGCKVRGDFPILGRTVNGRPLVYLDNNATTLKPFQVIRAVEEFYKRHYSNIHRGVHTLSLEATQIFEESLERIARLVGARPSEAVPVYNASHGLNLAALLLSFNVLGEGDEVVVGVSEHHSSMLPWRILSRIRGFRIKYAYPDEDLRITRDGVERLVSSRTRVIAVAHVSNVTGSINDVEGIARAAREAGAYLVVDAAQSVPHMPVDAKALGADFMAFSGHKMLGPSGTGILYIDEKHHQDLEPVLGGGDTIADVTLEKIEWADAPWKYHPGTPNIEGFVGLGEAVKYLEGIGMEAVRRHEESLNRLADRLVEEEKLDRWIELLGPRDPEKRTGTLAFRIRGASPNVVGSYLDLNGIAVRTGKHCAHPLHYHIGWREGSVRASYYIYNTEEEIRYLVETLSKYPHKPQGI